MRKSFMIGSLFTMLVVALLAATNVPASWSWNSKLNAMSVLFKDGGGTKFLASAMGVTDGSSACTGCVGESYEDNSGTVTATFGGTNPATATTRVLPPGNWIITMNCGGNGSTPLLTAGILVNSDIFGYPTNSLDIGPATGVHFTRLLNIASSATVYTKLYANSSGNFSARCHTTYLRYR